MARPVLEVADIFRDHGPAWRKANAGHVSLGQLKVMSAIESCRTAALGGHVMRCEDCSHTAVAYNSCRNRHCPKCQGSQALAWMEEPQRRAVGRPSSTISCSKLGNVRLRHARNGGWRLLSAKSRYLRQLPIPCSPSSFRVETGLSQLSTPRPSVAITSMVAIIIVAIVPGPDVDTSRPDLNIDL